MVARKTKRKAKRTRAPLVEATAAKRKAPRGLRLTAEDDNILEAVALAAKQSEHDTAREALRVGLKLRAEALQVSIETAEPAAR
jgi:hypothetical protein